MLTYWLISHGNSLTGAGRGPRSSSSSQAGQGAKSRGCLAALSSRLPRATALAAPMPEAKAPEGGLLPRFLTSALRSHAGPRECSAQPQRPVPAPCPVHTGRIRLLSIDMPDPPFLCWLSFPLKIEAVKPAEFTSSPECRFASFPSWEGGLGAHGLPIPDVEMSTLGQPTNPRFLKCPPMAEYNLATGYSGNLIWSEIQASGTPCPSSPRPAPHTFIFPPGRRDRGAWESVGEPEAPTEPASPAPAGGGGARSRGETHRE